MGILDSRRRLRSCGLLLLPILGWNVLLTRFLPAELTTAEFWRDIPSWLTFTENTLRVVISVLPFMMPLEIRSTVQRSGLVVFGVGAAIYFGSWVPLMVMPDSRWAVSPVGFMAPAYTPLVWLVGISLLGQRLYWGRFYRWWMFLLPAVGFVVAHLGHVAMIYARAY